MTESDLQQSRQGVGARLRETRRARGVTQADLGQRAGLNQAVVVLVEEGVLWHPSVISSLAMALNTTQAWIQWSEPFSDKRVE